MSGCFLGIDTSNYTTSVALAENGEIIANLKLPLPVKEGECGLRQSDALFAHVKNIPLLCHALREALGGRRVTAVGVSDKPRNAEGSYMPCFLAGVSVAEGIAAALGVPLYRFSHQCGHLRAALYSANANDLRTSPFGAFHISGGTTEMLSVLPADGGFATEIVGGTRDLSAGQLVDRIGVMLGLRFPCGAALEELATRFEGRVPRRRVKTENGYIHLSGMENLARSLYQKEQDAGMCASFVLTHIADALIAMSRDFRTAYGEMPLLYAGGVMSNAIIRRTVEAAIPHIYFAAPAFSTDNAAGTALLAAEAYRE